MRLGKFSSTTPGPIDPQRTWLQCGSPCVSKKDPCAKRKAPTQCMAMTGMHAARTKKPVYRCQASPSGTRLTLLQASRIPSSPSCIICET